MISILVKDRVIAIYRNIGCKLRVIIDECLTKLHNYIMQIVIYLVSVLFFF